MISFSYPCNRDSRYCFNKNYSMKFPYKLFSLFVLFFLITLFWKGAEVYSQNKKIDSLKIIIKSTKEDTSKVNALNDLSDAYSKIGLNDSANSIDLKSIELARLIGYSKGEAIALKSIGNYYYVKSNYSSALENYFNSIKIAQKINNKDIIARNYANIANVYLREKDFKQSHNYYKLSLSVFEEIHDTISQAISFSSIGSIYSTQGNLDDALEMYFKAEQLFQLDNNIKKDPYAYAYLLEHISSLYYTKKEYSTSLKYALNALKINTDNGFADYNDIINRRIAHIYMELGRFEESEVYLNSAMKNAEEAHSYYGIVWVSQSLSELFEKQKKLDQALYYYKLHMRYKDSLYNETKSKQIAELQTKYDVEKKNQELKLSQSQLHTSELKKYFYIATSLFLIVLVILIGNRYKKQKQTNKIKQQLLELELEKSQLQAKELEISLAINHEKLNNYTKQLVEKTELLHSMQEQLNYVSAHQPKETEILNIIATIKNQINPDNYWAEFITTFNLVHKDFFNKIKQVFPDLTHNELQLCALIKCNLANKEIANILNLSVHTVKSSCVRIGKKMKLSDEEQSLRQYILKI